MKLILRWLLNAGVLLLIAKYYSGVEISGIYAALISILALGLVNAIIRPIVLIFSLPVTILTLGLFTFVVNALMFWFVSTFIEGFSVSGFRGAFIGAFLMTVGSWFIGQFLKKSRQK